MSGKGEDWLLSARLITAIHGSLRACFAFRIDYLIMTMHAGPEPAPSLPRNLQMMCRIDYERIDRPKYRMISEKLS